MNLQRKYNYLVVDDEYPIMKIISDILTIHPATNVIFTANNGEKAYQLYEDNKIDIVFTDILMPGISGLDFIKKIREKDKDTHIIVVTAYGNIDLVREAIRNGAYDYILKPFSVDEILFSVNRVMDRLHLLEEKADYVASLEKKVKEVTENLEKSFFDTLNVILNTLEARDKYTMEHSHKVASYAGKLARFMGLSESQIAHVQIGGILHDIGKIGVPDSILQKAEQLSDEEFLVFKQHCQIGKNIVMPILSKNQDILDFIYLHHERYDGKGYPEGLSGDKIPLVARIAGLVNAFVIMTSSTSFNKAKTIEEAVEEIKKNAGVQFDPDVAAVFLEHLNEIVQKE